MSIGDIAIGFSAGCFLALALYWGIVARRRAAPTITLYPQYGYTLIDFPTHVEGSDGQRFMILVSTIYDDGDNVGPENTEAVCQNIETAHAFIDSRFNNKAMRCERVDDDPLASYRLFFMGDTESNMTIWTRLIPLEAA